MPITAITIEHSTTDYYLLANFSVLNRGKVQVQIQDQVQGDSGGHPRERPGAVRPAGRRGVTAIAGVLTKEVPDDYEVATRE